MKSFSSNKLFNLTKKNLFLINKTNQNLLIKNQIRFFGSSHHHEITGEVDNEKIHVKNPKELHKFVNLIGLNSGDNNKKEVHIHGHHKALFAQSSLTIPLIHQSRRPYRGDLSGTLQEENPYFHPEPYGYIFHDDPFDTNGQTFHMFGILLLGFWMSLTTFFLLKRENHPDSIAKNIFHAHYAANLIEDEIIKIREKDYPFRLQYARLKAQAEGRTFEEAEFEES